MSGLESGKLGKSGNVVIQKRFGVRIETHCGTERLTYSITDYSGARCFNAPYETLRLENLPTLKYGNILFFRRILTIPFGLFLLSILTINDNRLSESIAIFSIICFVLLLLAKFMNLFSITFTQIPMEPFAPGSEGHLIRIIKNKDHDGILANIVDHWKARMLALYGEVQPDENPDDEAARLKWLRALNVISDEELRLALLEIEAVAKGDAGLRRGSLN